MIENNEPLAGRITNPNELGALMEAGSPIMTAEDLAQAKQRLLELGAVPTISALYEPENGTEAEMAANVVRVRFGGSGGRSK